MKYVEEYRDADVVHQHLEALKSIVTRPWTLMEVCGGQTHSIVRFGIDRLLPKEIRLLHGPGCPVCVTPVSIIDKAIRIAEQPGVIFCSFGDMLRVPGSESDLFHAKSRGADVRKAQLRSNFYERRCDSDSGAGREALLRFRIAQQIDAAK